MERIRIPEAEAESPSLYAAREPVFPKAAAGFYRRLKWWIMGITLAIESGKRPAFILALRGSSAGSCEVTSLHMTDRAHPSGLPIIPRR